MPPLEISAELARWLAAAPSDAESARRSVEPYRDMSVEERLRELSRVNAWFDVLLDGGEPVRDDGETPFWRLWTESTGGGARRDP